MIASETDLRHFGFASAAIIQSEGLAPDMFGIELNGTHLPSLLNKMIRYAPKLSHLIYYT
jgi:hypothetical protein